MKKVNVCDLKGIGALLIGVCWGGFLGYHVRRHIECNEEIKKIDTEIARIDSENERLKKIKDKLKSAEEA